MGSETGGARTTVVAAFVVGALSGAAVAFLCLPASADAAPRLTGGSCAASWAQPVVRALDRLEGIFSESTRRGVALVSGVQAALSSLRFDTSGRAWRSGEGDDALFIG